MRGGSSRGNVQARESLLRARGTRKAEEPKELGLRTTELKAEDLGSAAAVSYIHDKGKQSTGMKQCTGMNQSTVMNQICPRMVRIQVQSEMSAYWRPGARVSPVVVQKYVKK